MTREEVIQLLNGHGWCQIKYGETNTSPFIVMNVPAISGADHIYNAEKEFKSKPSIIYYYNGTSVEEYRIDGNKILDVGAFVLKNSDETDAYVYGSLPFGPNQAGKYYVSVVGTSATDDDGYYTFGPMDLNYGLYQSVVESEENVEFVLSDENRINQNIANGYVPHDHPFSVEFHFGEYKANQLLDLDWDDDTSSIKIDSVNSNYGAFLDPVSSWGVRKFDYYSYSWSLTDDYLLGWSTIGADSHLIYYLPDDVIYSDFEDISAYAVYSRSITANITYHNGFSEATARDERNLYGGVNDLLDIESLGPDFHRDRYEFIGWETDSGFDITRDDSGTWQINVLPEPVDVLFWIDRCQDAINRGFLPNFENKLLSVLNQNRNNRVAIVQYAGQNYGKDRFAPAYMDFTNNISTIQETITKISTNPAGYEIWNNENLWCTVAAATDSEHFHWRKNCKKIVVAITDEPFESYYFISGRRPNGTDVSVDSSGNPRDLDPNEFMCYQGDTDVTQWPDYVDAAHLHDFNTYNVENFKNILKDNDIELNFVALLGSKGQLYDDPRYTSAELAQANKLKEEVLDETGGHLIVIDDLAEEGINAGLSNLFDNFIVKLANKDQSIYNIDVYAKWRYLSPTKSLVFYHSCIPNDDNHQYKDQRFPETGHIFDGGDYVVSGIEQLETADSGHWTYDGYEFVGWTIESTYGETSSYVEDGNYYISIGQYKPDRFSHSPYDFLFWVDSSISMEEEIADLRDNISRFCNIVFNENSENRIGCVQHKNSKVSAGDKKRIYYPVYDDRGTCDFVDSAHRSTLINKVRTMTINGGVEDLWGVSECLIDYNKFSWNDNHEKICVVISDEPTDMYTFLAHQKYIVHAKGSITAYEDLENIADKSVYDAYELTIKDESTGIVTDRIQYVWTGEKWVDVNSFDTDNSLWISSDNKWQFVEGAKFDGGSALGYSYVTPYDIVYNSVGDNSISVDNFKQRFKLKNSDFYFVSTMSDGRLGYRYWTTHAHRSIDNIAKSLGGKLISCKPNEVCDALTESFVFSSSQEIHLYANWRKIHKIWYHENLNGDDSGRVEDDGRHILDSGLYALKPVSGIFDPPTQISGINLPFINWSDAYDNLYDDAEEVDLEIYEPSGDEPVDDSDFHFYANWDYTPRLNIRYYKNSSPLQPSPDYVDDYRNPLISGEHILLGNPFENGEKEFNGWKDANGVSYDDGATITVNSFGRLDLYAQWKTKGIKFVFSPGKMGIEGSMDPVIWPYDDSIGDYPEYTVPQSEFTDPSNYYDFAGWQIITDSDVLNKNPGDIVNLQSDAEFIAKWKSKGGIPETECSTLDPETKKTGEEARRRICKIVFYSGFGENDSYEQCCGSGVEIYLAPEQFSSTRPGYKFLGWGIAANDEVLYLDQDLYTPMECPSYLYGQWEKIKEKDDDPSIVDIGNEACIVGYDPLPVVFRDMSDVRSFKTKFWRWDFGDSIVLGCDTRNTDLSKFNDPNSEYSRFELPGDDEVHRVGSAASFCIKNLDTGDCTQKYIWKENIDYFHDTVKQCLMNVDYDNNWKSYHYNNSSLKHFTGINFMSSTGSTSGDGFIDYKDYDAYVNSYQHRFTRLPNSTFASFVEVDGIRDKIIQDQCQRIGCEMEHDFGNSVAHIYKGPGLYYATMVCSSENQSGKDSGLQGMEISKAIYDSGSVDKQKVAGCWVNVLPVCPCVSGFHVYGTYNTNGKWDEVDSFDSRNRRFLTVTNPNFSCDDDKPFDGATGYVDWNCQITFTDFDGNTKTTKAVSGYAPYLQIGASGKVVPRSLPVTGAWFDWSDWSSDYMDKDHKNFGEIVGGWPNWPTQPLNPDGSRNTSLSVDREHVMSGDHVYTLPGLYSVGISPEFDNARIKQYMPTVSNYDDCIETTLKNCASGNCILVVEIPPKFVDEGISCDVPQTRKGKETTVANIRALVKAGSYPISRIDWDFGDGSKILSISTEGFRVKNKDVVSNAGCDYVDYDTELNRVRPIIDNITTTSGYLNGNPKRNCYECKMATDTEVEYLRYPYERLDARNYLIDHTYIRTRVDDGHGSNGYKISCSAYAENTNTCAVYEKYVLNDEQGAGLPDFDAEEGNIELVDVRTDSSFETNIVLQSQKESRLYVNRIV